MIFLKFFNDFSMEIHDFRWAVSTPRVLDHQRVAVCHAVRRELHGVRVLLVLSALRPHPLRDRHLVVHLNKQGERVSKTLYSTFRNRRTPQGRVPGTQKKIKMTRFVPGTRKKKVAYPPSWGVRFSRPPRACENFAYRVRDFFLFGGGTRKNIFRVPLK